MNRLFEVNLEIIPEVEAKKFINKLSSVGFVRLNKPLLNSYMSNRGIIENNTKIALSHIKSSYIKFVIDNGWSERKYADVTFILASYGKLFTEQLYNFYGNKYDNKELNNQVLKLREVYKPREKVY